MSPHSFERPVPVVPVDDLAECAWDDPLTRLLLLLEIAEEPSWLREAARSRRHPGAQRDSAYRSAG